MQNYTVIDPDTGLLASLDLLQDNFETVASCYRGITEPTGDSLIEGMLWSDTSATPHRLKQYTGSNPTPVWDTVATASTPYLFDNQDNAAIDQATVEFKYASYPNLEIDVPRESGTIGGGFHVKVHKPDDSIADLQYYCHTGSTPTLDVEGDVLATGEVTSNASDERLKSEFTPFYDAIASLKYLTTGTFYWDHKSGFNTTERQIGLKAGEVDIVFPEAVKPAPFDLDEYGESLSGNNYKTIQYEKLVVPIIAAIQELDNRLMDLENRLKTRG